MKRIQEIWKRYDFFETMYQSVPCGILHTFDEQGENEYLLNHQGVNILGFSSMEELQKQHPKSIANCFVKDDLIVIDEALKKCKCSGEIVSYQCRCLWGNREVHYLQVQSQTVKIDEYCIIQTVFFDITNQVLAEENRKLYRNVINNASKAFFSIYIINLKEDTFSTITQTKSTEKVISSQGAYWEAQRVYITKFVHPEDQERLLKKLSIPFLKSLKEENSPIEMEYRTVHENGTYHWTRIQAIPASFGEDGSTEMITVTNTDIDSQKKEEEALHQQDLWKTKLNNLVLENSNVRDFCYYPKEDCLVFPKRTMETYGVHEKYDQVSICFLKKFISKDNVKECEDALFLASNGKKDISVGFRLKKSKEWCRVNLHVVQQDEDGSVLNILGIIENLTELKRIDTDNKIMHEMCDFSVKSHYELMLLIDQSNCEYQMFSAASDLYRNIPNKGNYNNLIKQIMKSGFLSSTENDFDFFLDELMTQLENTTKPSVERIFKCIGYQNETYWKKLEYSLLPSDETKIMMLITDVSEEEKRKEELKEAVDVAQEANKAKSSFLANMSHEIRTPMNAILGMGEILLHKPLDEEVKSGLVCIQNVSEGLLSIINDILDFSKIESGKFELVPVKYDLRAVLLDIANLISMRLSEKDIYFFLRLDPSIPQKFIGDDIRIKQMLVNILGNAVKFTEHGSIELSVYGAILAEQKIELIMEVKDTGIGIKEEDMENLFGQFVQVDTTKNRNVTGTGLGLAISKNMAQAMGGDIKVESTYCKGSTFRISIIQEIDAVPSSVITQDKHICILVCLDQPIILQYIENVLCDLKLLYRVYDPSTPLDNLEYSHLITSRNHLFDIEESIVQRFCKDKIILLYKRIELEERKYKEYVQLPLSLVSLQMSNILNGAGMKIDIRKREFDYNEIQMVPNAKILIVDDNMTNLYVCEELMKPYQMQIETVDSGYLAIDKAKDKQFDLILMDQMMPGMDGIETTAKIRQINSYYEHSCIVALSANALAGARENFLQQGFDDYLEKPIKMAELNRVIETYVVPLYPNDVHPQMIQTNIIEEGDDKFRTLIDFDVNKALEILSNDLKAYHSVLRTYQGDMIERREKLVQIIEQQDIHLFVIYVHAIKSASRSVGAFVLANLSEELEHLGNEKQWTGILSKMDSFMQLLTRVIKQIQIYFESDEKSDKVEQREIKKNLDKELLSELKTICDLMDYDQAEGIIRNLRQFAYEDSVELKLESLQKYYEEFDYEKMEEMLHDLVEG